MKLFYRQYGEGQPVIIMHGIFGISDNWVTIGRKLAEKFSVYILDLRNHGQSPHSNTFNYIAMMEDLQEFIEDHQLENPILIGHSMGGKVAMYYSLEYPDHVNSLIVVDISMRRYPHRSAHINMIDAMLAVDFEKAASREEVEQQLEASMPSKPIRLFVMKNLERVGNNTFKWRINLQALSDNIAHVFEGVEHPGIYENPALFVRGGKSDYISDEDMGRIKLHFPGAHLETIQGASHWMHAEKPEELCSLFSEFTGKTCEYKPPK
jgi:pimeloyl-ACP methyl ester carboxylesterase